MTEFLIDNHPTLLEAGEAWNKSMDYTPVKVGHTWVRVGGGAWFLCVDGGGGGVRCHWCLSWRGLEKEGDIYVKEEVVVGWVCFIGNGGGQRNPLPLEVSRSQKFS